jgi:hypothetical protein
MALVGCWTSVFTGLVWNVRVAQQSPVTLFHALMVVSMHVRGHMDELRMLRTVDAHLTTP